MLSKPGQGFGRYFLHRDLGHDLVKLIFKHANPTIGQDNISVEDLARLRIDSTWTDRRADVVVQPADKVVLHVFRIFVHVSVGLFVLHADFDRVNNPNLFKSLVPIQDALPHPASISHGRRVFDVEDDGFFRRA